MVRLLFLIQTSVFVCNNDENREKSSLGAQASNQPVVTFSGSKFPVFTTTLYDLRGFKIIIPRVRPLIFLMNFYFLNDRYHV